MAFFASLIFAFLPLQAIPPTPTRLVTDYTQQTLSASEISTLEEMLLQYEDSTSVQIAIAIFQNIGDQDIAAYAVELGRAWGVGTKDNKGVLMVMSKDDRKIFIAPGYGLEGALPDATVKTIINNYFIPSAKAGNLFEAFQNSIIAIEKALMGEKLSPKPKIEKPSSIIGFIVFLFVIVFFIIIALKRNNRGGGGGGLMSAAPLILGSMYGHSKSGWGSISGGSQGGSFGGFGGGSFGGGGAGGSW